MARDRGGHQVDHRHGLRVRLNELTAVDGPFLAWADVSTPPLAAQRPWSLDGAFHFDGECFEINPVMGYTLATRGVAVRGPAAAELGVVTDATDRRTWVRENVDTYWPAVLGQVRHAVESDPERSEFDPAMHEWCALGIARMADTFETSDVVSKSGARELLIERRPATPTSFGLPWRSAGSRSRRRSIVRPSPT